MMTQQVQMATQMHSEGRINDAAYFAIVNGMASVLPPVLEDNRLDLPVQLYRSMLRLRDQPNVNRDSEIVETIYELIAANREMLPDEFLNAVEGNLDAFDGERVPGQILRDGLLSIPSRQAKRYDLYPTGKEKAPGTVLIFGQLPSFILNPTAHEYPGGYTGTYMELWYRLLTAEQRIDALRNRM